MLTSRTAFLLSSQLVLHSAMHAQARDPGPLVTDRPDQTESTVIVPPGFVQVEAGWSLDHDRDGLVRLRTHTVPGLLLRVGLTSRLEARLGFAGWHATDTSGLAGTERGHGDTDLGVKYRLRDAPSGGPTVSVIASVSFPTGSATATSGEVDPSALLTVAHELSERLSLGYNLGPSLTNRQLSMVGTLSLGAALAERLGAFVETFGSYTASSGGGQTLALDGGVTVLLGANLQLDASAGTWVLGKAGDWFVASGLSVRLPR